MKRGIILKIVVVGLVGVILAITLVVQGFSRLPDPAVADRQGLLRWIVTRDLSEESAQVRRTLVQRFEQEFSSGQPIEWHQTRTKTSPCQFDRLCKNLPILLQVWLQQRAEEYDCLSGHDRIAYLDATLEKILRWQDALSLNSLRDAACRYPETSSSREVSATSELQPARQAPSLAHKNDLSLDRLTTWLERWKQSVEPEERRKVERLVAAIEARWLYRRLLESLPGQFLSGQPFSN